VGLLLSFLPGNSLLHSALALEKLGGWKGVCPSDGPQPRHHIRCGEKTEEKTTYRLLIFKSKTPQFLGLQILLLWISGSPWCVGSNVLTGSVFWWNIFHLRNWGDVLCWQRPGRPDRPNDIRLPQDDKVHLSQVWNIRKHREARCLMHSSAQYSQWENLYFYLVLAPFSRLPLQRGHCVQNCYSLQSLYQGICSQA